MKGYWILMIVKTHVLHVVWRFLKTPDTYTSPSKCGRRCFIPGPTKGCQIIPLQGVNPPSLRVFHWHPNWKVLVEICRCSKNGT